MKTTYIVLITLFFAGCSYKNLQVDSDRDGVYDYIDTCKSTPSLAKVDKYGCALDSDNDGVIDLYDKCQNTPILDKVTADGCSIK
jgi:OOP family OmpA-OmpF porin